MIQVRRAVPLLVLSSLSLVAACRKKPAAGPEPVATTTMPTGPTTTGSDTAGQGAADAARREAERQRMLAEARTALLAPIYFDYDQSEIRADDRPTMDRKIALLSANPAMRIRIAGHTDSRGSDEYNLALGQRRAAAAKRYLTQQGIDAGRIDIVSFGEERPAQEGESEDAWARNRRDEFEIVTGGDNIVVPAAR